MRIFSAKKHFGKSKTNLLGLLLLLVGSLVLNCTGFAQAGVPIWTNYYNGPDDLYDSASSLTADKSGQIYVAGTASIAGLHVMQTIKYASSGLPIWTNRFGAAEGANGYDIAPGGGGQGVYVVGFSQPLLSQYHHTLIAYSAGGAALWTNRYSVPDSGTVFIRPAGIASDVSSGNVYLTGVTAESQACDFFTIAYSPTGTPLWTNFFGSSPQLFTTDIPVSIGVASNGNIYVSGNSTDNWVTIAYSSVGQPLWTNWFDGEMNSYDSVSDLAVANNGDVIVAGAVDNGDRVAMVRYSSAGVPLWTNLFEVGSVEVPPKVFVADDGKTYGTWELEDDYATIAIASNGAPIWTNIYGGPDVANDEPSGLTADASGYVYVTGMSDGDWLSIAYSASGSPLWTNRFGGDGDDYANGMGVSEDGEVYVAGGSDGPNDSDWVVIRYAAINPSPIQLQIQQLGTKAVMNWADSRFTLQAAPMLTGAFTNIPGATSPFTNSVTGAQQFFRLKAN